MKSRLAVSLLPFLIASFFVCVFSSPGQGWQPASVSGPWSRIACSADGTQVMVVGEFANLRCANGVYASTNSGGIWFQPSADAGVDVAGSVDGSMWIVADYYCSDLLFTNPPATLTRVPISTSSSLVAISSDGSKLFAGGTVYGIYVSTDSGNSWQQLLPNVVVSSMACSADGTALVAGGSSNFVYTTTDFGVTWSTNVVDSQFSGPWSAVACSFDASRMFAASDDGVFVSTNAGGAWTQIHGPASFRSIAISGAASQIAAAATAGLIYTSTNSGLDWSLSGLGDLSALGDTNSIITSVAMSADGSKMFAAPQGGNVYTNALTPSPLLKVAPAGTNLDFSWPFPSTGFVLQQTTDPLTNLWLNLSAVPTSDLSSLRVLASIPAPGQTLFYRLAYYQALQSSYLDLDFESGRAFPFGPGRIQFLSAFPGWTGYNGSTRTFAAVFDDLTVTNASIGLQTNSSGQFDGKYYASIVSGVAMGGGSPAPVQTSYLSQTGLVPSAARSLLFRAIGSNYVVTLQGKTLKVRSLGGNFYGADVTAFHGSSAVLNFVALTNAPPRPPFNALHLDSISFSTRVIP